MCSRISCSALSSSPLRPPRRRQPLLRSTPSCVRAPRVHLPALSDLPVCCAALQCSPQSSRSNARWKLSVTSDGGQPRRAGPAPSFSTPISPARPRSLRPRTGPPRTTRAAARTTAIQSRVLFRPRMIPSISSGSPPGSIPSSHHENSRSFSRNTRGQIALRRPHQDVRTRWDRQAWGGNGRC